jgi:chemotaxis protein MotB
VSGGSNKAPIIIKKIKKNEAAAHGGAWKVAYADFVTAMMAFFLLLWLLNVTTSEQKSGISDYFSPASPSKQASGAGGVLGGQTITAPGAQINSSSPPQLTVPVPSLPAAANAEEQVDDMTSSAKGTPGGDKDKFGMSDSDNTDTVAMGTEVGTGRKGKDGQDAGSGTGAGEGAGEGTGGAAGLTEEQIEAIKERLKSAGLSEDGDTNGDGQIDPQEIQDIKELLAKAEDKAFQQTQQQIMTAIQKIPELRDLQQNVIIEKTAEGARIQLVDQEGYSMFPGGSAAMSSRTAQLMSVVAQAVSKLPNKLSISGHTDSTPFSSSGNYSNWELSTDRANASRRALEAAGVAPNRFETVIGKADKDPLFADDTKSPRNRRVSIVVLRDDLLPTADSGQPQPVGPAPNRAGSGPAPSPVRLRQ